MRTRGPVVALVIVFLAVPWAFPAEAQVFTTSWQTLPSPRSDFAAVAIEGLVYIFGGSPPSDLAIPNPILIYDPSSGILRETETDLSTTGGVRDISAVWTGTKVLLISGAPNQAIREYDPWTDTLTSKTASVPGYVIGSAVVWDGDEAWIFGGHAFGTVTTAVYRYDPAADVITAAPTPLEVPLVHHGAFFDGNLIYVMGGASCMSCGVASNLSWTFHPTTGARTALGPIVRGNLVETALVYAHPNAYKLAGTHPQVSGSTGGAYDIWQFTPATGAWVEMPHDTPHAITHPAAAWDGKQIILLGGRDYYNAATDAIWHYRLRPPMPDLQAHAGPGPGVISLTWDSPAIYDGIGSEGFPVERYELRRISGPSTTPLTLTQGISSYRDAGLAPGEDVVYELVAFKGAYASETAILQVKVQTIPGAPEKFTAFASGVFVTASWEPPSDPAGEAEDYRIYKSADANTRGRLVGTTQSTEFIDDSQEAGVWFYRATARNGAGEGTTTLASRVVVGPSAGMPLSFKSCLARDLTGAWVCTPGSQTASVLKLVAGGTHTCVLLTDNRVDCWGDNSRGQSEDITTPTVTQLVAGKLNTCAVTDSGALNCYGDASWGKNSVSMASASGVAVGGTHICAVASGGTPIKCAGADTYGQAPYVTHQQADKLVAGERHTCRIFSGNFACFGDDRYGQAIRRDQFDTVQVVAGERYTCYRTFSGLVGCGGEISGPLAPITTAVQISGGARHACALLMDRSVTCWGDNGDGQAVGDTQRTAIGVAAGTYHTCFLRQSRTVDCVGASVAHHDFGQTRPYP